MSVSVVETGRRGVSPLIAAVLLIAFTMAVAAILTAWVTTFTQEQTSQLGNKSSEQIDCSFGQLEVFDTTDGQTGAGNYWVTVALTNTGTVDFNNTSLTALNAGSVVGRGYIDDLQSGQTQSQNVTGLSSEAETVRIASDKCPTVSEQITIN